jgi:molybdopterin synthase sulfur carrier subunit
MKLELRFFASLREALGLSQEIIEVPEAVKTVSQLRTHLIARGGVWAEALAEGRSLRCALNQTMVNADALIDEGAEVAFFPPVTGG